MALPQNYGSTIQVDDVTSHATSLDKEMFDVPKAYNTIHQYNEKVAIGTGNLGPQNEYNRKLAIVKAVGMSCNSTDVPKAVQQISKVLNHIREYDADAIKGFLGPIVAKVDATSNRAIVVSYPALTDMGQLILEEDFEYLSVPEGGEPIDIEDVHDLQ